MEGEVRIQESLRVKIGEAKNLVPPTGPAPGRDTYCSVTLDQEQIFKTSVVEKNLNPFYGEEFQCEIPRKFRFIKFYIYDSGVKQDKILGNVVLKKEDLPKYHAKDHWFPLTTVDADSEVQGKVHLELRFHECISSDLSNIPMHRLSVRVIDCSDLTIINGACNPYTEVVFIQGRRTEVKRTAVKKKTICPHFDETFFFYFEPRSLNHDKNTYTVEDYTNSELSVSLWHDDSRVSREVLGHMFPGAFLGEVKISLRDIDNSASKKHNAWYFLRPRESCVSKKQNLGSLRLKISYTSDHVFSSHYYDDLRNLLLKSPELEPVTSSAAYILGEVVEPRHDAAEPIVRVFLRHGEVVPLIQALADWEISKTADPNTVFRGNTLASKCVDELMKLVGLHYLHDTLKNIIDEIFTENKACEVDPTRIKDGENLDDNMANLQCYVHKIIDAITASGLMCPTVMCEVFFALKEAAMKYFPDKPAVRYQVVSGFVFLRFFAPAILCPRLFNLRSDVPDETVSRKLTLISKAIQSLGNLVSSKTPAFGFKEQYMVPLFTSLTDDNHIDELTMFLDIISSASRAHSKSIEAPIVLKESYMTKRAQGRKKFGLKNFKKRYFSLTNQYLIYAKAKGEEPLCEIPVEDILAVEKVEEGSFKMKHMFQVVQPERTLYIQANNCVEEKEWIDILTKICKTNEKQLRSFHPAAYLNGHYLCCKSVDVASPGCSPVTGGLPANIKLDIDSDREIERIHSLFLTNMEKLEQLQATQCSAPVDDCAELEVYTGEKPTSLPSIVIEDSKSCFETLNDILKCVISLEQEHKQYAKAVQRRTVYGSEEAPIGDGQFLLQKHL